MLYLACALLVAAVSLATPVELSLVVRSEASAKAHNFTSGLIAVAQSHSGYICVQAVGCLELGNFGH